MYIYIINIYIINKKQHPFKLATDIATDGIYKIIMSVKSEILRSYTFGSMRNLFKLLALLKKALFSAEQKKCELE